MQQIPEIHWWDFGITRRNPVFSCTPFSKPQRSIIQRVHSGVQGVPECQPTSCLGAMLKVAKPEDINMAGYEIESLKALHLFFQRCTYDTLKYHKEKVVL